MTYDPSRLRRERLARQNGTWEKIKPILTKILKEIWNILKQPLTFPGDK